jgi:glycosyltransferase involved in cell wall biosynthesis
LAAQESVEIIDVLGSMPRSASLRHASRAHVGVSFVPKNTDDINLRHMVGASNKSFDYMACGLPLLVTDLPDWTLAFVRPGFGRCCDPDDPDSVAAALQWFLDHIPERREMGRRGQKQIRTAWNYEAMFAKVLSAIENG